MKQNRRGIVTVAYRTGTTYPVKLYGQSRLVSVPVVHTQTGEINDYLQRVLRIGKNVSRRFYRKYEESWNTKRTEKTNICRYFYVANFFDSGTRVPETELTTTASTTVVRRHASYLKILVSRNEIIVKPSGNVHTEVNLLFTVVAVTFVIIIIDNPIENRWPMVIGWTCFVVYEYAIFVFIPTL